MTGVAGRDPDDLVAGNRRYAASFQSAGMAARPARKVAVLTCMDTRVDPLRLLDIELGDAHILRNAGGRASDDALRSLVVSTQLLGTRVLVVIHHTDCGMLGLADDDLRARLARDTGADASQMEFLGFDDLHGSVREDCLRIRACALLPEATAVHGYVYDVDSGRLTPVEEDPALEPPRSRA